MKATNFRKQGQLGCVECFSAFEKDVRAIVSQMAARPRHAGKVPRTAVFEKRSSTAEGLRDELRSAVEREDYELAATLRDRLRTLDDEGAARGDGEDRGEDETPPESAGTSRGAGTPPGAPGV
jgi:protein arginine kinase activator